MKILHILAQLPEKTGSGVYFSCVVDGFKQFNYEQKAVFAYQGENNWSILDKRDQYLMQFKTEEMPFPIAGMSDVMPYENTVYSSMTEEMIEIWKNNFRKTLMKVKSGFKPDVIFAHHLWILTSMVPEIFPDVKIVGLCHNTDLRQAIMNPHMKEKYVKNIDKLDMIFSISEIQKKEIVDIYNVDINKIISVGGGFNQRIFYPPVKKEFSDIVRLVFCAKIDPSKGVYELIEVYKSLGEKNVSLDIIGAPDEINTKKIKKYVGDDTTIKVYNVQNQVALSDVMREMDIFLMPSYYEGLGLMAIECLACGLYAVTTDIEALRNLLGEDIVNSEVIKFVPLPRIYDVDKPYAEDLPQFKSNLKTAILQQIEKVRNKKVVSDNILEKIHAHSWDGLVKKMNELIK